MLPAPVPPPGLRRHIRSRPYARVLLVCLCAFFASTDDLLARPSTQVGSPRSDNPGIESIVPLVEVDVAQPGPVELAVPPELGPWVRDDRLIIVDPAGNLTWAAIDHSPSRSQPWLPGQVLDVSESEVAMTIVIDVGEAAAAGHDRLRIELRDPATVSSLRLEASEDGASWRPVSTGVLFAAGDDASMHLSELSYPATDHRFLRLIWPLDAPRPAWRSLLVHRAPTALADAQRLAIVPIQSIDMGSGLVESRREWLVSPPAFRSGSGLLDLSWHPGTAPAGLRIHAAVDGGWRTITSAQANGGISIDRISEEGFKGALRMELSAASGPAPELTEALYSDTALMLRWRASTAGRYLVAASLDHPERLQGAMATDGAADRATSGNRPSTSRIVAPTHLILPTSLRPSGAAAPGGGVADRWTIQLADDVAAGTLVGLALPPGAPSPETAKASRLRLLHGGRQLPYAFDRNLPPRKIAALRSSPSVSTNPAGAGVSARVTSKLELDLPTDRGRPTLLELYSTEGPFERHVTVSVDDPSAPVGARSERVLGRFTWRCPTPQAMHCRQSQSLTRFRPSSGEDRLRLTFADDENPPLSNVEVQLWAPDVRLIFVAPADPGPLSLVAFEEPLRAPRYDLEPLLQRWASVAATTTTGATESGEAVETSREMPSWLLTAALAAATVMLLWVLTRTIGGERSGRET